MEGGHEHFTECSSKFGATIIQIFHASILLRYLKYYTKSCRNFSAKFLEISRYRTQNFQPIFPQPSERFPQRKQEMLRKDSHYHYTEGFWNLSEIFCVRFEQRTRTFHEMFKQVWSNIYWNISRKLPVKILEILHKILQKLFCKVSWNIQISHTKFSTNISKTLQKYFPKDNKKCCVIIRTIMTRKVPQNLSEIFCVRFGRRTRTFHEMFWKVWSNIYWNISRKLLVKIL